jgi:hypothetical protein
MDPVQSYSHVSRAPNTCIHEKRAHTHAELHRFPVLSFPSPLFRVDFRDLIMLSNAKVRAKMQLIVRSDVQTRESDLTFVTLTQPCPNPQQTRLRVTTEEVYIYFPAIGPVPLYKRKFHVSHVFPFYFHCQV